MHLSLIVKQKSQGQQGTRSRQGQQDPAVLPSILNTEHICRTLYLIDLTQRTFLPFFQGAIHHMGKRSRTRFLILIKQISLTQYSTSLRGQGVSLGTFLHDTFSG